MTQSGYSRPAMNMKTNVPGIPWKRLLTEGTAIVTSILLAFWIDASWDSKQERAQGRRLTEALVSEIAENDSIVTEMAAQSIEATVLARKLLVVMSSADRDDHDVDQMKDIGNVFIIWDWAPDTHVYEQALASGQLLLIEDSSLRIELASYHSRLDHVGNVVEDIRIQYVTQLEPFFVENTIYTDVAYFKWLEGIPEPPFSTDLESLSASPELWNLIALRLEHDLALTRALERAQQAGEKLSKSLLENLN